MPIEKSGQKTPRPFYAGVPKPTIRAPAVPALGLPAATGAFPKPAVGAPATGPAQQPPPRPRGAGGPGAGPQWPAFAATPFQNLPSDTETRRLLQAGSRQQFFAQRALQQYQERVALSDAQEVFRLMNTGYAQALVAAEIWAEMNMPSAPSLSGGGGDSGGGSGYGGFGGGSDPRGYALALGLYNWRIG